MQQNNMFRDVCRTCGAELVLERKNLYVCPYCGNHYSVQKNDPPSATLRLANACRESFDFAKAESLYLSLIRSNPDGDLTDVYWGLFLLEQRCVFEEDEHGDRFPSFYDIVPYDVEQSEYFKLAVKSAQAAGDAEKAETYRTLAKRMQQLKLKYQTIKRTTKPYDIFICFKKNASQNTVTADYKLAYELYNRLSRDYNVFFSERSLSNIVVREYEPNIYHALYTAKVMLVLCSRREYLDAQWVKNEWSRFREISKNSAEPKAMIPIFIDGFIPDYLPDELRSCQGVRADVNLMANLTEMISHIVAPIDRSAMLEAELSNMTADFSAKFEELNNKVSQQQQLQQQILSAKQAAPTVTESVTVPVSGIPRMPVAQATPAPVAQAAPQVVYQTMPGMDMLVGNTRQLADSFYEGRKYKAAKDKYLECLNVNAGDYRSRYMCELCDVNISLDNDSLAGLADATKRYIGSWTFDKTADKYNMIPQSLSLGSVLNPKSSVPAALKQYRSGGKYASGSIGYHKGEQAFAPGDISATSAAYAADAKLPAIPNLPLAVAIETLGCYQKKYLNKQRDELLDYYNAVDNLGYDSVQSGNAKFRNYINSVWSQLDMSMNLLDYLMSGAYVKKNIKDCNKLIATQLSNTRELAKYCEDSYTVSVADSSRPTAYETFEMSVFDRERLTSARRRLKEYAGYVIARENLKHKRYLEAFKQLKDNTVLNSKALFKKCSKLTQVERYNNAINLYKNKQYAEAKEELEDLAGYRNADKYLASVDSKFMQEDYRDAQQKIEDKDYEGAKELFVKLSMYSEEYTVPAGGYKDSAEMVEECDKQIAKRSAKQGKVASTVIMDLTLALVMIAAIVGALLPVQVSSALSGLMVLVVLVPIVVLTIATLCSLKRFRYPALTVVLLVLAVIAMALMMLSATFAADIGFVGLSDMLA